MARPNRTIPLRVVVTQVERKGRICWQPVLQVKNYNSGHRHRVIGTYLTHKRAVIGSQLFKHWMSLGFDPLTIPRCPR